MKILAIRGKNLASLSQGFEVDFSREPLASCGIFAITGPTGAGKSTLLDALCLALYDNTPRLLRASSAKNLNLPDVAGETIAPRDTRTLLRRGATEGFAEVDFVGNDQVTYRARWAVRRARNRANGKLQTVEMTLVYLPEQAPVGSKLKTEVLTEIEARVGLSFEQFTRAVLLAQNEFAAFLKASEDERAELLETLTGTAQFAQISMQAFQRAKQERERGQALQARLAAFKPLEAEARAALQAEQPCLNATVQHTLQQHHSVMTQIQWHEQWQQLQQAQQQAHYHLTQANQAKQAAHQRMHYFQQVEAVQAARLPLDALDKAQQAQQQAEQALLQAQSQLTATTQTLAATNAQLSQTQKALQLAHTQQAQAQLPLQQAKQLDTLIATTLPTSNTAEQALDQAQQQVQKVQHKQQQQAEKWQEAQQLKQKAQQWLENNQEQQVLAEQWGRWDTLLTQAAQQQQQLEHNGQQLNLLKALSLEQAAQVSQAQQAQVAIQQQLTQAQYTLNQTSEAYAGFNADALADDKAKLIQQKQNLTQAQAVWQQYSHTQANLTTVQQQAHALSTQLQTLQQQSHLMQTRLPNLEHVCLQAERSLQLAEQACQHSAETMRAALQPDSPCPVCGSLDHPYSSTHPPLQTVLHSLRLEAQQQRLAYERLQTALHQQQTEYQFKQHQYQQLQAEEQALEQALVNLHQQWTQQLAVMGEAQAVNEWADYCVAQQEQLDKNLQAITQQEQALRTALQQRDQAQQVVNQAQAQVTHATARLNQLNSALQQTQQQQATLHAQQTQQRQQLSQLLQQLNDAFTSNQWQTHWQANPYVFQQTCKQKAQDYLAQQKTYSQADKQCTLFQAEKETLHILAEHVANQYQQAQQHYADVQAQLHTHQTQRQQLLQGQSVKQVEAALTTQIAEATHAFNQAQSVQQEAQQAYTQASAKQQYAQALAQSQQTALQQAQQTLTQWLQTSALALEQEQLRTLLAHDTAWLKHERQALQQLDTAISNSQALLQERQTALSQHEQQRQNQIELADLHTTLSQLNQHLDAAKKRLAEVELDLKRDDERLEKMAAISAEVQQQLAQARVWEQLNELIGSADGKKFRNFAQQYSLDVLLSYANRHLQDVARRYRLQRVKESLALLVIDQDLGNETRSVHSLSGGESFLVSLALALGLASLSSHRVKVESLFIDEGFGSLDADSLQMAMDALDNLQAQGRKVGVISHIQEMMERIAVQIRVKRLSGGQSRLFVG